MIQLRQYSEKKGKFLSVCIAWSRVSKKNASKRESDLKLQLQLWTKIVRRKDKLPLNYIQFEIAQFIVLMQSFGRKSKISAIRQ